MFKQISVDKNTILGTASVGRVILPYLIGTKKKSPPDMTSTVPYFPGLTGTTLTINIEGDVTGTINIVFTGNSVTQAIADINTNPDLTASDVFGYLSIASKHSGNRNVIKVTGGTSVGILGFYVFPHPAGVCYAGEIDSGKPTYYENRSKGSTVLLEREPVQKEVFNRSSAGVSYILDTLVSNLNREIAVTKEYDVAIAGTSFTISSDDRFYLPVDNIFVANPSQTRLEKVVTITDDNHNLVFDNIGNRVGVTSITYGPLVDATSTFSSWNIADGKSIFGSLAHYQKIKTTNAIGEIVGNILHCSGATFVTNKVQANDILSISGATNYIPYNHDGEYFVEEVISEEYLRIRPKGTVDPLLISSYTPSALNPNKQIGDVYGTLTTYLGKFCPLTMKADSMTFNLSSSLTGNYKVTLPIGRTLSQILQSDFIQYLLQRESGGQIELGSKLASALLPRIIVKPSTKTLVLESLGGSIGFRIYALPTGGVEMTYNSKWTGAIYVKDDLAKDSTVIREDINGIYISTDNLSFNLDVASGKIINKYVTAFELSDGVNTTVSVPPYTGLVNSNTAVKAGLYLGSGFTTNTEHLVPKIQYNSNTTASTYTLLNETILSAARKRDYVKDDGTSITTLNAKWDGTQWVKDVSGNPSIKQLLDGDSLKTYGYTLSTGTFLDSAWSRKDRLKRFIIDDDFTYPQKAGYTTDIVDAYVSDCFSITTSTNTSHRTDLSPPVGNYGELVAAARIAGVFSGDYSSNIFSIGTSDFELQIKVRATNPSELALQSANKQGLTFGISDPTNGYNIWLKAASDNTHWYCQAGNTLLDIYNTPILIGQQITITFKRVNSVLYSYVDSTLFDTRAFNFSMTGLYLTLFLSGTSMAGNNDMYIIDFIRFWAATLDR